MAGAPLGNQNAKRAKLWEQSLKRALARKANGTVDDGLDKAADKVVKAAIDSGEQWALLEIGNRLDGKPAQAIVGDSEQPLEVIQRVERVLVRAKSQD